jgi:hypothetical protein
VPAELAVSEKDSVLTLDEAVEAIWEEVASRRAATVSEAVDNLWPLELSSEDNNELARQGLISIAHYRQAHRRNGGRPAIAFGKPHGKNWAPYIEVLSAPFEDSDGREKSLLDFDAADWGSYVARCTTVGAGWMKRAQIGKVVLKKMDEHHVSVTRDLPVEVLEDVASRFEKVFAA